METKFTKEIVDSLANKLLIGLNDEENKMVLDEFEEIDEGLNLLNQIPGIENVEPMSWCLDRCIDDLREDVIDESIPVEDLLRNADYKTDREIEVPRVVA